MDKNDPYLLTEDKILEPPEGYFNSLKFLGPGVVMSAAIVGSGELIATTILGATSGFVFLWLIILSCVIKVTAQLEFGKRAIQTGETTMASFNGLPGPRLGKASWPIWLYVITSIIRLVLGSGILGATALVLKQALPFLPLEAWLVITAIGVALIGYRGYYQIIEKSMISMTLIFTFVTLFCVVSLQFTPYSFSYGDLLSGLSFTIPLETVFVAAGVFGITGIGTELVIYNYWLIEKGYAAYTGPRNDTEDWIRRAKGWTRVMYYDSFTSLAIYTTVTIAFYILGASILNQMGIVPAKDELVATLSHIYTETLGPWAQWLFLPGAFAVLLSSLVTSIAAGGRVYSDALSRIGLLDFRNMKQRWRWIGSMAWIIPGIWIVLFLHFRAPGFMILVAGVAALVILLIIAIAALNFRYSESDSRLTPSRFYDLCLWVSCLTISWIGIYGLIRIIAYR